MIIWHAIEIVYMLNVGSWQTHETMYTVYSGFVNETVPFQTWMLDTSSEHFGHDHTHWVRCIYFCQRQNIFTMHINLHFM